MADPTSNSRRLLILASTLFAACLGLLATRGHSNREAGPTDSHAPAPWTILNRDGLARFEHGDYSSALVTFERALALRPNDEVIQKNVAQAHGALGWEALRGNKFPDAQAHFDRAIAVYDREASYHIGRSLSFSKRQMDQDARDALEVALNLKPDDALANTLLGDYWYERNEFKRALAAWEKAERADPSDRAITARLDKLRSDYGRLSQLRQETTLRFTILFEGRQDERVARRLLDLLEDAYQNIGRELGYYPGRPISVVLYTDQQFRDVTRSPAWTKGLFDGKIHLPVGGPLTDDSVLMRVIAHELTHAFVYQLAGNHAPTWLNEGLAQWFEASPHPNSVPFSALPIPLRDLHGSFLEYDEATVHQVYAESLSATAYLIEHDGLFRMTRLLEQLVHNPSFDQAFEAVYLRSYSDFETAWANSIESPRAQVAAE